MVILAGAGPSASHGQTRPTLGNPRSVPGYRLFDLSTLSGTHYVLQYKDELSAPNWAPLQTVTGTGDLVTITNASTGPSRFYRAVAFPDTTGGTTFFVSPGGLDTNSGDTPSSPFASLARVQGAVRARVAQGLDSDLTVWLRAGRYELQQPLMFGPADAGDETHAVRYAAFPGEEVTISGGRRITGWQPGANGRWTVHLPEVQAGQWYFRQLFINGRRAVRARYPNSTNAFPFLRLAGATFSYATNWISLAPAQVKAWDKLSDVEVVLLLSWEATRKRLVSVNETNGLVTLAAPFLPGHDCLRPTTGTPCYFENAAEFLDTPGEWYLDRQSGVLSYWPQPGEDPAAVEAVAPVLTNLMQIIGDEQHPVRNLHFQGLAFEHCEWPLPPQGQYGIQACMYYQPGDPEPNWVNWSGRTGSALEWTFAQDCSFEDGALARLGGSGLSLRKGCTTNTVQGNRFFDIGGNGVMVGEDLYAEYFYGTNLPSVAEVPAGNQILNNHICRCGVLDPGAVGCWVSTAEATRVAHNLVHGLPYSGISVGWFWGTNATAARNGQIEFNHVYDVMGLLADGGAIYTLGFQPGTVLRGNLLHDVKRSVIAAGSPNNGIYFDNCSQGYRMEDNIIYATAGTFLRFFQSSEADHTWGTNYYGLSPGSAGFPQAVADKAGLSPAYSSLAQELP